MKPKLYYRRPLVANHTKHQALDYAEFYSYLDPNNFRPCYLDDIVFRDVARLIIEVIDGSMINKNKPQLNAYINEWYPDRNFYPADATYFIWLTYEEKILNKEGHVELLSKQGSLHDVIGRKPISRGLQLYMSQSAADKLLENFKYLVKNCILLPGNSFIESMAVVTTDEMATHDHEFIKGRKDAVNSSGNYTVMVKLVGDFLIGGQHTNIKYMALYDILNDYKVKMISMPG